MCFFGVFFQGANSYSSKRYEVYGSIQSSEGKLVHNLFGKWNEAFFCGHSASARCIWRPGKAKDGWTCTYLMGILKWQMYIADEGKYLMEILTWQVYIAGEEKYFVGILKWQVHIDGEEKYSLSRNFSRPFWENRLEFSISGIFVSLWKKVVMGSVVRGLVCNSKLFL